MSGAADDVSVYLASGEDEFVGADDTSNAELTPLSFRPNCPFCLIAGSTESLDSDGESNA